MPVPDSISRLSAQLAAAGLQAEQAVPLARLGFWRIGGPADLFVRIEDTEALQTALRAAHGLGVPVSVLGRGSNLLVADAGVRGLVVRLEGSFKDSTPDPGRPEVWKLGAGLPNTVLLHRLQRACRGGLACLAGVPGTVGGAVKMNAGWSLGEIADVLLEVEVAHTDGTLERLPASALRLSYRRAHLPPGSFITHAWVTVLTEPDAVADERDAIRQYLGRRKATQPLALPSCGSVFKNPPGDAAGRLIDACGLKGTARGGAQISDLHANFIVNTGGATAADVYGLVCLARDTVFASHGVVLEPEVHAVGDWPEGAWPLPAPAGPPA